MLNFDQQKASSVSQKNLRRVRSRKISRGTCRNVWATVVRFSRRSPRASVILGYSIAVRNFAGVVICREMACHSLLLPDADYASDFPALRVNESSTEKDRLFCSFSGLTNARPTCRLYTFLRAERWKLLHTVFGYWIIQNNDCWLCETCIYVFQCTLNHNQSKMQNDNIDTTFASLV